MKQTVLFGEEDEEYLRMAGDVLEDQVEDVLDVWYGFVGSHPHLVYYFGDPEGEPDAEYLGRVRSGSGAGSWTRVGALMMGSGSTTSRR